MVEAGEREERVSAVVPDAVVRPRGQRLRLDLLSQDLTGDVLRLEAERGVPRGCGQVQLDCDLACQVGQQARVCLGVGSGDVAQRGGVQPDDERADGGVDDAGAALGLMDPEAARDDQRFSGGPDGIEDGVRPSVVRVDAGQRGDPCQSTAWAATTVSPRVVTAGVPWST